MATCNVGGEITGSNNGDNYGDTGADYYDSDNPFPLGTGMEIHDAANSLQTVLNNFSTNTWDVRVVGNYIVVTYTPLDAPSTVVFQGNSDQAAATYGFLANVPINTGSQYNETAPIQFDACGEPIDPTSLSYSYTPPDPVWTDPYNPGGGSDPYFENDPTKDCAGVKNGTAYRDTCGICVAGTTGKQPCVCPTDSTIMVTAEMLKYVNPSGKTINATELQKNFDSSAYYLNIYMKDYGVNTRQRLAFFLANASEETENFRKFIEDTTQYTRKNILALWPSKFESTNVQPYVNCTCVLDRAYADNGNATKHNNGNEAS